MEATLLVPGARLYYKTRGSGPILLLLPGGDGDADSCDALAAHLEGEFTVVTYDRRGLSRSTYDGSAPDVRTHADDAGHVLAAITADPAYVFGASIGALIGLELTARHPGQVRRLIAHEPPIASLLPEDLRAVLVRGQQEVEEAHRREGTFAAMARFARLAEIDFTDREDGRELSPPSPSRLANLEFFLTHDAPAVRTHQLDVPAVTAQAPRIIAAAGTSASGPVSRCAYALADLLDATVTTFPGGHNGFAFQPRAFAERLRDVLA